VIMAATTGSILVTVKYVDKYVFVDKK